MPARLLLLLRLLLRRGGRAGGVNETFLKASWAVIRFLCEIALPKRGLGCQCELLGEASARGGAEIVKLSKAEWGRSIDVK